MTCRPIASLRRYNPQRLASSHPHTPNGTRSRKNCMARHHLPCILCCTSCRFSHPWFCSFQASCPRLFPILAYVCVYVALSKPVSDCAATSWESPDCLTARTSTTAVLPIRFGSPMREPDFRCVGRISDAWAGFPMREPDFRCVSRISDDDEPDSRW